MVLQNVEKAQLKLKTKKDNVAGICVYWHDCMVLSQHDFSVEMAALFTLKLIESWTN